MNYNKRESNNIDANKKRTKYVKTDLSVECLYFAIQLN